MVKLPTQVASKSHLRDAMNRLRSIRKRCGKDDENKEVESSGDPFRDMTTLFGKDIAAAKEMILERNEGAKKMGQDRDTIEQSHDINRLVHKLDNDLLKIRAAVDVSEKALAKANRKKKAQTKINLLEQQLKGRQNSAEMCADLLRSVKEINEQRFAQVQPKKGKGGVMTPQMQIGKKMLLRQQLLDTTKGRAEEATNASGGASVNLAEAPETAEQMKVLRAQEQKINQGLDRLSKGVGRLKELAIQIGGEIDSQNTMLAATEDKVDDQVKDLKRLNKRLKGLIEKSKPMNTFLNIGCFLLLLALVGYFLYEFGVV